MKPFAPKTRVSVTLREQEVIADVSADRDSDSGRVEVLVLLWDVRGSALDWKLSRPEIAVIARAAQMANET